jgi:isorenieratene synthase
MAGIEGLVARWIERRLGGYRQPMNAVDPALPSRLRAESRAETAAGPRARKRVAVVGAGIAGLAAATLLAERGFAVTLHEANDFLGGKLGSWPVRFPDGFQTQVEHGFHAFFRQYYNLRRLLDRLGASRHLIPIDDYRIMTLEHGEYGFKGISTVPVLNMLAMRKAGVYRLGQLMRNPESRRLLAFLGYDPEETFARFDQVSFEQFADQTGLPPTMRLIFHTFARAFFAEARLMSMAEMIKSFHFYFLSNDLGLIYDVLDDDFQETFLEPARRLLETHGAAVRTGHPVQEIGRRGQGFRVAGEDCDYVVLAADVVGTRKIAAASPFIAQESPELGAQLSGLKPSQAYAVLRLWLDRPLARKLPFFLFTDRIRVLDSISLYHEIEKSAATWARASGGGVYELHSYAVPDGLSDKAEVRQALLDELHAYLPELKGARILYEHMQLRQDFTAFHTGLRAGRPGVETPVRNLYLAGDWVKLPVPAMLMEAACTSGWLAANRILAGEGLQEEPLFTVPRRGLFA